ncbi:D-alanyl-D-alanine-carboxypeptidase/endopeptidase AmpH [Salipiger mucosus]|nr:D-alanyl-D-alanine-carboxypeptidase/endopeptidase AmpH [Salipiger mucosus]
MTMFGGLCAPLEAQDSETDIDALIAETMSLNGAITYLEGDAPGLILGVVSGDTFTVQGFGETERGNGIEPDGDTVFRVGSITKVFAGEMLAHGVARSEVAFTDPVAPLLPGRLGEAASKHPSIRLIDLATHAGGLPREVPRDAAPMADPFQTITHDAFAGWLEENTLNFRPGTSIAYSNFGFDLLSAALSTAGGAAYPDLLASRITGPLGMTDTAFVPTDSMERRIMSGHAPNGEPLPTVPTGTVITGSGGLYSTANDLLRWMRWHLDDGAPDAEARFLDHGVYVQRSDMETVWSMDESGRMDGMGLGWVAMKATADHPFFFQKSGALQGQMSYIAFAPGHEVGVFATINQFDFEAARDMTEAANEILFSLSGF